MKQAFTLIETVIVIAILVIISAILIPSLSNSFKGSKEEIIDIANNRQILRVIDIDTKEIIYEGSREGFSISPYYTLIDINLDNGFIIEYVRPIIEREVE